MSGEVDSQLASASTGRRWWWVACALALILLVAALFRVGLTGRMLPQGPEPDSYLLLQYDVFTGRLERKRPPSQFGFYPTMLARSLALVLGDAPYERAAPDASTAEHLRAAARPQVALRTLIASLSVAGVAGVFLLARQLLGTRAGLVASALVALSLLHLLYSHQARPHAAHMTFQVWALFLLVRQIERPSIGRIAAAALAASLCMSTLQTGVWLIPAFGCAALLSRCSLGLRAVALAALAAAWGVSQLFQVGGISVSSSEISLATGGHEITFSELNGRGVLPTLAVLRHYEPVLACLALAGLLVAVVRRVSGGRASPDSVRRVQLLALSAYAIPYLTFALLNEATRERYLIPLLPFMAVLGAYAVESCATLLPQHRRALQACVFALALALPIRDATKYFRIASAPDTLEQAAAWLERQPDGAQARIVTSSYVVLPLRYSSEALHAHEDDRLARASPWVAYQLDGGPPPLDQPSYDLRPFRIGRSAKTTDAEAIEAALDELKPTYVVLELSRRQRSWPAHAKLEQVVQSRATRVAAFNPEGRDPPLDELFQYGDVARLRTRVAESSTLGPPLEIYRWNER